MFFCFKIFYFGSALFAPFVSVYAKSVPKAIFLRFFLYAMWLKCKLFTQSAILSVSVKSMTYFRCRYSYIRI